jgi:hypothetical protein
MQKNFKNNFFRILKVNDENKKGSGSISQRRGSPDPDPHQNVMNPQYWHIVSATVSNPCIVVRSGPVCALHRRQGGFLLLPKRRVCRSCGILRLDQGGAVCHSSGGSGVHLCHRTGTQSASSSSHTCRAIDFVVLLIFGAMMKKSIIEHFAFRRRKR